MKPIKKIGLILIISVILIKSESHVIDATVDKDTAIEVPEVTTESSTETSTEAEISTSTIVENTDPIGKDQSQNNPNLLRSKDKSQKRVEKKIKETDDVHDQSDLSSTESPTEESSVATDVFISSTEFETNEGTETTTSFLTDFNYDLATIDEAFEELEKLTFVVSVLDSILKGLESGNFTVYQQTVDVEQSVPEEKIIAKRNILKRPEDLETETCTPCPQKGYFRFKQSCRKYYDCQFSTKCNGFVSKIRTCPKCLKFNAKKKLCDLPENVPECSYPDMKKYCTGPGRFLVPGDCRKFYDCESTNGTLITLSLKSCPPSTIFDHKEKKCVEGEKCIELGPKCAPGMFYLNNKFSCRKFYYCSTNDGSAEMDCPPNHIFNGQVCEEWGQSKLNWENFPRE